ncbi:thioredoxin family protein [Aquisalimonas sp.]|uniref:protein-disulfide reductase DsbD family protein n=1 Tax=Aquisalimonas sp. TaxID=1872621 RepID=UPI0025BD995C|nr:thioredoxin family protein [Aquisalimonas sp.]
MRHTSNMIRLLGALALLALTATAAQAERFERINVDLISDSDALAPGEPFWVGVHLRPDEGWGTYWRNPGAAGLATSIQWESSDKAHVGGTEWPLPDVIEAQGVTSYGYYRDVLLLSRVVPDDDLEPGDTVSVGAEISWAVCSDICILGDGAFSLELPVAAAPAEAAEPPRRELFERTREQLPRQIPEWEQRVQVEDQALELVLASPERDFERAERVRFFPYEARVLDIDATPSTDISADRIRLRHALDASAEEDVDRLEGVLVVESPGETRGYEISEAVGDGQPTVAAGVQAGALSEFGLLTVLLMGVAGGMLLNLMPCVFPILSIKALMIMESVKLGDTRHRIHAVFYALGVISFFCVIGGVLYVLGQAGMVGGWGFQLQSPWFVGLLAYILFLLGLNFSGLLSFGYRLMGVGQSLTESGGYGGSYFTGALAAVVATPCTAPFMGTAIAYALVQPPVHSLLVFIALGVGMALPFVVLVVVPGLARVLPRPGPWMTVFKQALAFPLYLTVIWLLWVIGGQTGAMGMAVVLAGLLLIVFVVWLRSIETVATRPGPRAVGQGLAVAAAITAVALLWVPDAEEPRPRGTVAEAAAEGTWLAYDPDRLEALVQDGEPVFLNATADWCISCIANERGALSAPSVTKAFREKDIVRMEADWTRPDPEIQALLERFGRKGIPLYVLFPGRDAQGDPMEPVVLPQFLSPGVVRGALENVQSPGSND